MFWIVSCVQSIQKYEAYCEITNRKGAELPAPYCVWDWGRNVNITLIALLFLWIPFCDHLLRNSIYPFLKEKLTYREARDYSRSVFRSLYEKLYGSVLGYFKRVNQKIGKKIPIWFMKIETFEHVHLLTKVFKWIVLPSNIIYGWTLYILWKQNTLDSIVLAVLFFFYSNFVPDLPAVFRRKVYRDERDMFHEELPPHKSYALLLFAPFFVGLLFCGKTLKWRTTETFHNFKSLAVYGIFLVALGFSVLLVTSSFSIGTMIEVIWVTLFALLGYSTHLKVDQIL